MLKGQNLYSTYCWQKIEWLKKTMVKVLAVEDLVEKYTDFSDED